MRTQATFEVTGIIVHPFTDATKSERKEKLEVKTSKSWETKYLKVWVSTDRESTKEKQEDWTAVKRVYFHDITFFGNAADIMWNLSSHWRRVQIKWSIETTNYQDESWAWHRQVSLIWNQINFLDTIAEVNARAEKKKASASAKIVTTERTTKSKTGKKKAKQVELF